MTLPNLFLIGAPKCGTTALYNYLGNHPQVFFPEDKEPHFFAEDFPTHRTCQTLEEYAKLYLSVENTHQVIGDASILSLYSKTAIQRILTECPQACFVVALRNPVELVVSLHRQFLLSGREREQSFEKAWAKALHEDDDDSVLHYPRYGQLAFHLHRVIEQVSPEKLHLVFLEDLASSPRTTYLSLLEFLNLPDDGQEEFSKVNEGRELRLPRISQLVLKWPWLMKFLKSLKLSSLLRKLGSRPVQRERLQEQIQQDLRDYYRTEIIDLSEITKRDLSHWLNSTPK